MVITTTISYTILKDSLSTVCLLAEKVAQECGIKILVEPEPGLLLENSRQFLAFIKDINSDSVGLNFDIGHFYCVREDPAKLVYELSDYIGHFHLADISINRIHNHLMPGKGAIDFKSVFGAIDKVGYKGFVTVELYPYQDNPIEAGRDGVQISKGHYCLNLLLAIKFSRINGIRR